MIAEDVNSIERHQRVHGSPRIERAARHVAEIDDLANALRADVSQHGFQREIVSVHIGNRGKAHVNFSNSSFREVTSYNLQERCYGDLPHLGEAGPQHPPLVLGWNPGSDSQFAGVLASLYKTGAGEFISNRYFFPG